MEILFRGLTNANTWVFGLLRKQREKEVKSNMVAYTGNWDYYIDSHDGSIGSWLVNTETVGIFTGKLDANNAKIFGGDKVSHKDKTYTITYKDCCFWAISESNTHWLYHLYDLPQESITIIGNIHQKNDNG